MIPRRAFTYVELMIALTIIAILAAIAVPNFLEAKTRAQVARSKSELVVLKAAVEAYRLDVRAYPPNQIAGEPNGADLIVLTTPIAYLTRLPYDVFTIPDSRGPNSYDELDEFALYNYFNAIQVDPEGALKVAMYDPQGETPEQPVDGYFEFSGFMATMIWGIGPGASLPATSSNPYTTVMPDGTVQLLPYDPTNGTTSDGDIYITSP